MNPRRDFEYEEIDKDKQKDAVEEICNMDVNRTLYGTYVDRISWLSDRTRVSIQGRRYF